ncbi:MAG: hypothetical protein SPJ13_00955 [Bacteroidales bacterium]|nr:hypothetical protein [Bacteroidales bacterium]
MAVIDVKELNNISILSDSQLNKEVAPLQVDVKELNNISILSDFQTGRGLRRGYPPPLGT